MFESKNGLAISLDEATQKELNSFLMDEQQKAMFHSQVSDFTKTCWDKCITRIRPQLDSADRDATELILQNISQK
ncbi:hypothetical protein BDEG_20264 [Batrachochytrium dendrobatidis JEL423]|uniref:Mitochondrial import inner membrane translocase subunit n=1 Tax=Batrachochytrium dendrobatidis (strain JEL423) TaxID=403673 RepID=A0A177W8H9_BATDL|nr:hypothetical protein BDEG_20264 [Batrachochytrium dendrobatidis JEL423]